MTPFGSITAIISLLILFFGFIFKKIRSLLNWKSNPKHTLNKKYETLYSILIIIFIGVLLLVSTFFIIRKGITEEHNNISIAQDTLYRCKKIESKEYENVIILRLDDVQAFAWSDISIKMMNDALDADMPIVAGIIPYQIQEDTKITHFLKRNECNIEFALHGYAHREKEGRYSEETSGEFSSLNYNSTKNKIALAKKELAQITEYVPKHSFRHETNYLKIHVRHLKRSLKSYQVKVLTYLIMTQEHGVQIRYQYQQIFLFQNVNNASHLEILLVL